jgi:hypothetical protein
MTYSLGSKSACLRLHDRKPMQDLDLSMVATYSHRFPYYYKTQTFIFSSQKPAIWNLFRTILAFYLFEINFNIILPPDLGFQIDVLPSDFRSKFYNWRMQVLAYGGFMFSFRPITTFFQKCIIKVHHRLQNINIVLLINIPFIIIKNFK